MSDDESVHWSEVGRLADLDEMYPSMAVVEGTEVALCREGEEVFAVDNICTHAFARLSDGHVEGAAIVCPLHQGSFNLRTGEAVNPPCYEPIKTYPVLVKDHIVYVDVNKVRLVKTSRSGSKAEEL